MFQMTTLRLTLAIVTIVATMVKGQSKTFDDMYRVEWGGRYAIVSQDRQKLELILDEHSGAGFKSKTSYLSGLFHVKMRLSYKNKSPGFITSFFVAGDLTGLHEELDFEFFFHPEKDDKPFLNTNIFLNDKGQREQSIHLWFDPTAGFHTYEIQWGADLIVFFVDSIVIRVFKKHTVENVGYPSNPMWAQGSIWNASSWLEPVDWSKGPFTSFYEEFDINGCTAESGVAACTDPRNSWNSFTLSPEQITQVENVRTNNMFYDYCNIPELRKIECDLTNY